MSYLENTHNSRNPLIRFVHRRRFATALELIKPLPNLRLLDYGCGDGSFLMQLADKICRSDCLFGYEPMMAVRDDVRVQIDRDWGRTLSRFGAGAKASVVTCFEVLEHLTVETQRDALARIAEVLDKNGLLIISVPIEVGLPAIPKNILRKLKYGREHPDIYTVENIAKSAIGLPIPEHRCGKAYLSHMGFNFRDFESVLAADFVNLARSYSPFPALGPQFNSQVFYLLKPKAEAEQPNRMRSPA